MVEDEVLILETVKCIHSYIGGGEHGDIVVEIPSVKTFCGFQQVGELKLVFKIICLKRI